MTYLEFRLVATTAGSNPSYASSFFHNFSMRHPERFSRSKCTTMHQNGADFPKGSLKIKWVYEQHGMKSLRKPLVWKLVLTHIHIYGLYPELSYFGTPPPPPHTHTQGDGGKMVRFSLMWSSDGSPVCCHELAPQVKRSFKNWRKLRLILEEGVKTIGFKENNMKEWTRLRS